MPDFFENKSQKIFSLFQKDFGKKHYEDLLKKINARFLEKNYLIKNLQKIFRKNSAKIFSRMRSREDVRRKSLIPGF